MSDLASSYWRMRYSDPNGVKHHSRQNYQISRDFLRQAREHPLINAALAGPAIIEIGCGTGELSAMINELYRPTTIFATDFSREAVNQATVKHPTLFFRKFDILHYTIGHFFNLAIASNVLEHFRDYETMLGKMFELADRVLILVPYRQKGLDGYDMEGGAGHAVSFSLTSFKHYQTVEAFTFETPGWTHSGGREVPKQLAILLAQK